MVIRPMKSATLDYPVYTLDYKLLLDAGKDLAPDVIDELIRLNEKESHSLIPLLKYGSVHKDILSILQHPPYHTIFEEKALSIALKQMNKIKCIPPLLEFLSYFKEHDFYTYRHTLVVLALSTILAHDFLKRSEDITTEAVAGTMHDFGKICVPLPLLRKTTPLTRTEKGVLEHHTLAGFVLLSYYLKDSQCYEARVAKDHHERKDRSGYPLGIPLEDNMIEIVAVCDIYDALLSPRPYRKNAYDNRTALEEITSMAEQGKLSWDLVQMIVAHNRKGKPDYQECKVSTEKRGHPPEKNLYGIFVDEDTDNEKS